MVPVRVSPVCLKSTESSGAFVDKVAHDAVPIRRGLVTAAGREAVRRNGPPNHLRR